MTLTLVDSGLRMARLRLVVGCLWEALTGILNEWRAEIQLRREAANAARMRKARSRAEMAAGTGGIWAVLVWAKDAH